MEVSISNPVEDNVTDLEAPVLPLAYEPRSCASGVTAGFLLFGFVVLLCLAGPVVPHREHVSSAVDVAERRLEQDAFGTEVVGNSLRQSSSQMLISHLIQATVAIAFACIYKSRVVDSVQGLTEHRPMTGRDDFEVGLFDCFQDINYCLMVCFCPEVRQAHTNEVGGICGFYTSLFFMIFGRICLAPCCGPCCINVYFRMHLKDMMGIEDHLINDFCIALWCWPCAVGQQAISIDEYLGYSVQCCCKKVKHTVREHSRPEDVQQLKHHHGHHHEHHGHH